MKHLFPFRSKALQALVIINALILGLTGMVHAQSKNLKDDYTQKPVATKEKPMNKPDTKNEAKKMEKKQPKPEPAQGATDYKGAQPPQGGRVGQGPDHPQ